MSRIILPSNSGLVDFPLPFLVSLAHTWSMAPSTVLCVLICGRRRMPPRATCLRTVRQFSAKAWRLITNAGVERSASDWGPSCCSDVMMNQSLCAIYQWNDCCSIATTWDEWSLSQMDWSTVLRALPRPRACSLTATKGDAKQKECWNM
jgi:hypothetical protein